MLHMLVMNKKSHTDIYFATVILLGS